MDHTNSAKTASTKEESLKMIQETDSRPAFLSTRFEVSCALEEANDWQDPHLEPTLDEILSDPIVHLVLGRDHLEIRDVERFLKSASQRLFERDRSPNFGRVKLHQSDAMASV